VTVRIPGKGRQANQKRTSSACPGMSEKCRFCCKSRFVKVVKILGAPGAFFSYGSEGPHRRTLNSQAISAVRLRLYESSDAVHSKNSLKIRTDATFDFCNNIGTKRTRSAKMSGLGCKTGTMATDGDLGLWTRSGSRASHAKPDMFNIAGSPLAKC
jgi:hypothetical protein